MASFNWPALGGTNQIAVIPNIGSLPPTPTDGQQVITQDTDTLYVYNLASTSWKIIASPGAALGIGALDSQSANAQGAAIVSNVLSLQSADATHPGLVNTSAQTFGGTKTFSQLIMSAATASTVPYFDASKNLVSSAVTPTELGYVSGVTSALQTQLNAKLAAALAAASIFVGSAGGLATGVAMSGEASIVSSGAVTLSNAAVIAKVLTGYVSGAGTVSASDSILSAIQKINGNVAALTSAAVTSITGEASGSGPGATSVVLSNAAVIAKVLTGYTSGAGTVSATDSILSAIQKLNGNDSLKLAVANNLSDVASKSSSFNNLSPMTTLGDLIYGGASGAGTRLAGDTSNTRKFLRSLSSASVASAPVWDTILAADIPTLNQNTTGTAANVTGLVAVANGGTGVTASSGANSVMLRDANQNVAINNVNEAFISTATAGGTTTLTVGSAPLQQFTGTSSQIVILPNATTEVTGCQFQIFNRSTGVVTVKDGGSNVLQAMAAGSQAVFTCAAIGTSAGTWDISYTIAANVALPVSNGGTGDTSFTPYSVLCGGTTSSGPLQNVSGLGTAGQILTSAGPSALPTWSSPIRAGLQAISNAATTVSVTFSSAMASTSYAISATLVNTVDTNPQFQPFTITAYSTTGFTATFNAGMDSANYSLMFHAIMNA